MWCLNMDDTVAAEVEGVGMWAAPPATDRVLLLRPSTYPCPTVLTEGGMLIQGAASPSDQLSTKSGQLQRQLQHR